MQLTLGRLQIEPRKLTVRHHRWQLSWEHRPTATLLLAWLVGTSSIQKHQNRGIRKQLRDISLCVLEWSVWLCFENNANTNTPRLGTTLVFIHPNSLSCASVLWDYDFFSLVILFSFYSLYIMHYIMHYYCIMYNLIFHFAQFTWYLSENDIVLFLILLFVKHKSNVFLSGRIWFY